MRSLHYYAHRTRASCLVLVALMLVGPLHAAELMLTEATALNLDRSDSRSQIVIAMLGQLWLMPDTGGNAKPLTPAGLSLKEPRFLANGEIIIATGGWHRDEEHLWLIDAAGGEPIQLTNGAWRDYAASPHPFEQRFLFVSDRSGSADIWEYDLALGSSRQITARGGDELDPTYFPDGNRIAYVEHSEHGWRLQQQFYAGRPTTLNYSTARLSAPAVRPDGNVITFLTQRSDGGHDLQMLLAVQEMLVKPLLSGQDISDQPIIWQDRDHYLVARNGKIVRKQLATRGEQIIRFTGWLSVKTAKGAAKVQINQEPSTHYPFVLRADRVFDPITLSYQYDKDIIIKNGLITCVCERAARDGEIVIDLGDSTLLPGLIDVDTRIGAPLDNDIGAQLLAAGVTTIVSMAASPPTLNQLAARWKANEIPGPRLLDASTGYQDVRGISDARERLAVIEKIREAGGISLTDTPFPDLASGASLMSSRTSLAQSPAGRTYADVTGLLKKSQAFVISTMIREQSQLRDEQLQQLGRATFYRGEPLAISRNPPLATSRSALTSGSLSGTRIVAGSGPSPLPPALALHGELMAMHAAGMSTAEVIRSATLDAARALGLEAKLGSISQGKIADILILANDPLAEPSPILRPIATINRGQFRSISALIER